VCVRVPAFASSRELHLNKKHLKPGLIHRRHTRERETERERGRGKESEGGRQKESERKREADRPTYLLPYLRTYSRALVVSRFQSRMICIHAYICTHTHTHVRRRYRHIINDMFHCDARYPSKWMGRQGVLCMCPCLSVYACVRKYLGDSFRPESTQQRASSTRYTYIYIHLYMYTYVHEVFRNSSAQGAPAQHLIYICMYVCIYMYVYVYVCIILYMYACMYVCIIRIYMHMHMYIYMYIRMYTHIHICICIYICLYNTYIIYIYIM
jgi:hypothetical protein